MKQIIIVAIQTIGVVGMLKIFWEMIKFFVDRSDKEKSLQKRAEERIVDEYVKLGNSYQDGGTPGLIRAGIRSLESDKSIKNVILDLEKRNLRWPPLDKDKRDKIFNLNNLKDFFNEYKHTDEVLKKYKVINRFIPTFVKRGKKRGIWCVALQHQPQKKGKAVEKNNDQCGNSALVKGEK